MLWKTCCVQLEFRLGHEIVQRFVVWKFVVKWKTFQQALWYKSAILWVTCKIQSFQSHRLCNFIWFFFFGGGGGVWCLLLSADNGAHCFWEIIQMVLLSPAKLPWQWSALRFRCVADGGVSHHGDVRTKSRHPQPLQKGAWIYCDKIPVWYDCLVSLFRWKVWQLTKEPVWARKREANLAVEEITVDSFLCCLVRTLVAR